MIGWFLHWFVRKGDRRRAPRTAGLDLTAFYFDGGAPMGYHVRDISALGAYVETPWPWAPGTLMRFTLNDGPLSSGEHRSVVLYGAVARAVIDGMGIRFLFPSWNDQRMFMEFYKRVLKHHSAAPAAGRGSSLVEFVLLFPLFFLLVVNVANFAGFAYAWITVANAARQGAQYWVTGGATVYSPSTPADTTVSAILTTDITNLPNSASLAVKVCTYNNGTATCTCPTGTCLTVTTRADPEPAGYAIGTVDVWYTYQPLVRYWDFGGLNIHAALVPGQSTAAGNSVIHRQAVMRVLN